MGEQDNLSGKSSTSRTSTTAWCTDKCKNFPEVKRLQERISEITGFPVSYSEDLQALQYRKKCVCM